MNETAHTWWETTQSHFENLKIVATTLASSIAVSAGTILNTFPDIIAAIGMPIAVFASIIALKVQLVVLKNRRIESKKKDIELELLQMDRDERLARAEGTLKRRLDDHDRP